MHRFRFVVLASMILAAATSRLIPHPPNFTPIGAMALFGGACYASRRAAFLVPLGAMLLSDLAIGLMSRDLWRGLHALIPIIYGSFAVAVCLGFWLRHRRRILPIAGTVLASSVLFFVVSNLAVWVVSSWYPKTWGGLVACYVAALPFFRSTLLGDALYASVLFGGLALAEHKVPALREPEFVR
jgi:hypothetical protein